MGIFGTAHAAGLFLAGLLTLNSRPDPAAPPGQPPPAGKRSFSARASVIDPMARAHPELGFLLEKGGKPADLQQASVDTRVTPRGRLVIWLMGHNPGLFDRLSGYGLHAIRVHYANGWFGTFGKEPPPADEKYLGKIRLEAATGQDFSPAVDIPLADGMAQRALLFVRWLAREDPASHWEQFLTDDQAALRWDKVIVAGASHGATTAARFAIHRKVDRVVLFCGPRDQYENWQALPSATPANRYFGFSHTLDTGWVGNHYCRSWEMLGLNHFGPQVDVDATPAPYGFSRQLLTRAEVRNDAKRAHGCVTPGSAALQEASGAFIHEKVWEYLFTQPVEQVGQPVPAQPDCRLQLRK